jgi:biotin carboxyl carrier protein
MEKETVRHVSLDRNEYLVTIGGVRMRVLLQGDDAATVNGIRYPLDLRATAEGSYSLLLHGAVYEAAILSRRNRTVGPDGVEDGTELIRLSINGTDFDSAVDDERSLLIKSMLRTVHREQHDLIVRAPMPGLIARLLVSTGDTVRVGQSLAILEAMKMENELRAVQSGKIEEIFVTNGRAVEKDERLIRMTVA